MTLFGRTTGVDVNRDEGFGRVNDEVTTGLQRDLRITHFGNLVFNLIAMEERQFFVVIDLNLVDMRRHQHLHKVAGIRKGFFARDPDPFDVACVNITDRTLHEIALFINHCRRRGFKGEVADVVPEAGQIIEIALDFVLFAGNASGTQDDRHTVRHSKVRENFAHAFAFSNAGDLAGDATTTRAVRHQDAITARQGQIGCDRSAFIAAFFFLDLNQHDLAAFDDFLDLVVAVHVQAVWLIAVDPLAAQYFNLTVVEGLTRTTTATAAATTAVITTPAPTFRASTAFTATFTRCAITAGEAATTAATATTFTHFAFGTFNRSRFGWLFNFRIVFFQSNPDRAQLRAALGVIFTAPETGAHDIFAGFGSFFDFLCKFELVLFRLGFVQGGKVQRIRVNSGNNLVNQFALIAAATATATAGAR